ncbi:phosphoesterase [Altibacter sp. HG106]|uniref:phosphoesterase n=1 Tax=Altibacter sp. HG106 TaxID=3023937 RepID=UPI0023505D42|nr:phosphoesterase [Altibacter sp. HG106]MDC7995371.1 phosphoesterase [Altibacter sp. HG106]
MNKQYLFLLAFIVLQGCAIKGVMLEPEANSETTQPTQQVVQQFLIVGTTYKGSPQLFDAMETTLLETQAKNRFLMAMGDNVKAKDSAGMVQQLNPLIDLAQKANAYPYFIPGNYDWGYDKNDGLEAMEDYLEDRMKADDVLTPNNGCPLESIEIGDNIQLIIIDSQWYLADWDKHHKMNDKCEIKSREKLMLEVKGEIKKNANKLIFVAMHHPVFTNGFHAGRFSFRDHIFPLQGRIPLPGVATLINQIRSQGAVSIQDRFNVRYNEFATQLKDLLDKEDHRIVMISGHEKNLQYIEQGPFKQIISGAGGGTRPATTGDNGIFSYGNSGYVSIEVYEDQSTWASFYGLEGSNPRLLYRQEIVAPVTPPTFEELPETYPKTYDASVYELDEVEKTDFFKSVWGEHYRDVYGTKVTAPTALLDTLYGGLEVIRPGGGNQTRSLRLETKDGKEYNMRALRKSAVQFLQNTAFQGVDGEQYFTNTVPEALILDFYTAAHPYGAFAIPTLAEAAQVYYTTPQLFYVPKQRALGKYSEEYGDQLYMIVERPAEEYKNRRSFGYPDDVESTDDLLMKLREDEDYILDEETYIRARIFDMLVGDWDRHSDQWRWAEFEDEDGNLVFEPIPRDRDQVFANFDGRFLNVLKNIMGSANQFGVYGPDIQDVAWFNAAASQLDRALVKRSDRSVWVAQAQFIQREITPEIVDRAFRQLPEEVQDTTITQIKEHLLARKENLESIVNRYYDEYLKFQMITGTDKDDHFVIERFPDGRTQIIAYRIKDGEKDDVLFDRTFSSEETEELWLYGLDDDDVFEIKGSAKNAILLRIIGGQNKDTYRASEGKKIKIYDQRAKKNEVAEKGGAQVRMTNFYEANLYDYTRKPTSTGSIELGVGYNPDTGTSYHAGYGKEKVKFIANPYGSYMHVGFNYHSITQGIEVMLTKKYAAIFSDINFMAEGRFTSKNFTRNFFGFGNETRYEEATTSLDFNRVNLEQYVGAVGLEREGDYGSFFQLKYRLQGTQIIPNGKNVISNLSLNQTDRDYWGIPEFTFRYENIDDDALPTKGMGFSTSIGAIDHLQSTQLSGFVNSSVLFYNALLSNRRLVLTTQAQAQLSLGDQPVFYLSPNLGASNGLRGYRNQRFTGFHAALGKADLSYRFQKMKTFLFPLSIEIYGGYDIGRVWTTSDTSDVWHDAYGGGIKMFWTHALQGRASWFTGEDGSRVTAAFAFQF